MYWLTYIQPIKLVQSSLVDLNIVCVHLEELLCRFEHLQFEGHSSLKTQTYRFRFSNLDSATATISPSRRISRQVQVQMQSINRR
jgi:hypothetical protein